jgi:hypothetical protein
MDGHQTGAAGDDAATRVFVEKLKAVRQACEGHQDDELRETLRQALRAELSGLSEVEVGRRLDLARDYLVGEARQREQALQRLEVEVRRLASDSEALRAERDRLAEENARLRAAPGHAAGRPGLDETIAKMRDGLHLLTQGKEVTPESIGLPQSEGRLFRLVGELLLFALNYETGVHALLQEIDVGPGMGTVLRKKQKRIIEDRFRACLDNREGSIQALQEALTKNSRFLLELNEAYTTAVRQGVQSLLNDLDPQPILDENKGALGMINFEKAWRAFSNRHSDLGSLPPADVWERFFQETFKKKLADYLETGGTRG